MNLTRYERETIITYNEEEKTAGVYTHNKAALLRKLEQLSQARPDECKLEGITRGGQAADYIISKSWVRIYPPRVVAALTEEQKQKKRELLAALRKG